MELDSSASHSIAAGSRIGRNACALAGIVSGQTEKVCPEIRKCTDESSSWSYLFMHNRLAEPFEKAVAKDGLFRTFVHRSIRYRKEKRNVQGGVVEEKRPTVSGLVFIQGNAVEISRYLRASFPQFHLVNDCSTHRTAVIPDEVMEPFMKIVQADPLRIRFLLNPLKKYAEGNTLVQIATGPLAGLQGYIIRIDRDRKLVIGMGDMTVAIGGVHKECFENAEAVARGRSDMDSCCDGRSLDPVQESIDKAFYKPVTLNDVVLMATNIDLWLARAEGYLRISQAEKVLSILPFLLEEIGYYFTNAAVAGSPDISVVAASGRAVASRIRELLSSGALGDDLTQRLAALYEAQIIRHGYLIGVEV